MYWAYLQGLYGFPPKNEVFIRSTVYLVELWEPQNVLIISSPYFFRFVDYIFIHFYC